MNKILLFVLFIGLTAFSNAQDNKKSNKTEDDYITPRTGDWGIGIDAGPFFKYVGNFFSSSGNNNQPGFMFTAQYPGSVFVKYKINKKTMLRNVLIVGISSSYNEINNPGSPNQPNVQRTSAYSIGYIGGLEYSKSIKGRILAYYGPQAGIYVEPFTNGSITGNIKYTNPSDPSLSYSDKGGSTINFELAGFAGIEYFLLPRISLSGEIGLGLNLYSKSDRIYTLADNPSQISEKGAKGFSLAPNASGNLNIFIYF